MPIKLSLSADHSLQRKCSCATTRTARAQLRLARYASTPAVRADPIAPPTINPPNTLVTSERWAPAHVHVCRCGRTRGAQWRSEKDRACAHTPVFEAITDTPPDAELCIFFRSFMLAPSLARWFPSSSSRWQLSVENPGKQMGTYFAGPGHTFQACTEKAHALLLSRSARSRMRAPSVPT